MNTLNESTGERQLTKAERKLARREQKQREREQLEKAKGRQKLVRWIGLAVILILIVGGAIWLNSRGEAGEEGPAGEPISLEINDQDHVKGNSEAAVTLVEYGDFQCPACGQFHPVIKQLSEEQGDNLRIVFRHFPLRQIHPNAERAARAVEAAGQQGKFWEMHDILFEQQSEWSTLNKIDEIVAQYAQGLSLDLAQFESDLNSEEVEAAVQRQYQSGVRAKVSSTPTFFLNGNKVEGFNTFDDFRSQITDAIESAG